MCLERISAGSYFAMAAHPDGSGRVFLSTQDGKIWLTSMPKRGSRDALLHGDDGPFLDLTGAVVRLVGVAFHPEFTTNGRFFVSYKRDCSVSPACGGGRCWAAAAATNGSRQCGCQLVVSEFVAAKGGFDFSKATRAEPCEVRRILTLDLPRTHTSSTYSYQQHGGQIMFRPGDRNGYLYVITGHGGFSKNRGALSGVILRFDVGRMLPADGGRGGGNSRGTPKMVIVAMGLDNPSGCSFDSEWPFHLYCANVDQLQQSERVYEINTGGNHDSSTLSIIVDHGHPTDGRMPSIVGGLLYRGSADPYLKGRYLYTYASGFWTVALDRQQHHIPNVRCSRSSPLPCRSSATGIIIGGRVLFLGEEKSKDAFVLATGGVYRLVPPGHCGGLPTDGPTWWLSLGVFSMMFAFYLIWLMMCGGAGSLTLSCCNTTIGNITTNNTGRRGHMA